MTGKCTNMAIHIATRRNIALNLIARGIISQIEAAQLLGESRQAIHYMARDIDQKAARSQYLSDLWLKETARTPRKRATRKKVTRRKDAQQ